MTLVLGSLRLLAATLLVCVGAYTSAVLGLARLAAPAAAQGSLVTTPDGRVVGGRLVAQSFFSPRYFWPRPSAVGYAADAAGGSNESPTSRDLADRARIHIDRHGASAGRPLPADLATASGSGLDPHITVRAALYQAGRVAAARGTSVADVEALVARHAFSPGTFLGQDRLVNVLELNLALDGVQ